MKLRNKKTGGIIIIEGELEGFLKLVKNLLPNGFEDWEDVKEPKIEDVETRKAIKAWAKVNRIDKVSVHQTDHRWYLRGFNDREQGVDIDFFGYDMPKGLIGSNHYAVTELCGEEKQ